MDNITLYQFPRCEWGIPNESPFCMKLECFLRMMDVPYKIKTFINPKEAPNGKVPYLTFNDKTLLDSGCIMTSLNEHYDYPMERHLNEGEKAEAFWFSVP